MLIVGVNGSPRKQSSEFLLESALEGARQTGADTRLIQLTDRTIKHCRGCNSCLKEERCVQTDELEEVTSNLLEAAGLIFAAPSYFGSVPGVMKNFLDRTRYLKMRGHLLQDKPFAALSTSGLREGGASQVITSLHYFALLQGMLVVGAAGDPRTEPNFITGTMQTGSGWQKISEDDRTGDLSRELGKRVAKLAERLEKNNS